MVPAPQHKPFADPLRLVRPPHESRIDPDRSRFRPSLRAKGGAEFALRPVRPGDGDALQSYVRGLSRQSRYNRFLGALSELPPSELARALSANGLDTLTLLVTSTAEGRETVVGEARAALSCADRAGEFSLSIADPWQGLGIGAALTEEIERRAAADGIELLFGDVLRTNERMIALARRLGFSLAAGLEGRLLRIEKRLDAAPDWPCRKWAAEIAGGADAEMTSSF